MANKRSWKENVGATVLALGIGCGIGASIHALTYETVKSKRFYKVLVDAVNTANPSPPLEPSVSDGGDVNVGLVLWIRLKVHELPNIKRVRIRKLFHVYMDAYDKDNPVPTIEPKIPEGKLIKVHGG